MKMTVTLLLGALVVLIALAAPPLQGLFIPGMILAALISDTTGRGWRRPRPGAALSQQEARDAHLQQ